MSLSRGGGASLHLQHSGVSNTTSSIASVVGGFASHSRLGTAISCWVQPGASPTLYIFWGHLRRPTPVSPPGAQRANRELRRGQLQEGFDTLICETKEVAAPFCFLASVTRLSRPKRSMLSTCLSPRQLHVGDSRTLQPVVPALTAASCCLMNIGRINCLCFGCVGCWGLVLEVCQPSAPIPGAPHARAELLVLLLSRKALVGEELRELVLCWTLLPSPPQGVSSCA